jgi:hypothetical protein
MSLKREIELNYGIVTLREDSILTFKPHSNRTLTLDDLKDVLSVFLEITEGKQFPFYSDNSELKDLGFAERKFIGNNLHLFATASAVTENSEVIRFIGHTINQLFPPKVPMRMFKTEREAVAWLNSLKK